MFVGGFVEVRKLVHCNARLGPYRQARDKGGAELPPQSARSRVCLCQVTVTPGAGEANRAPVSD
ncbi:hypothetical protein HYDPIDRAFT_34950 [Hydnomerulius pinastri MD-312]|uniref:Uncharacterized protein n=1 Tax=Hydnomerulius pinastri MD-312 TaxID=994086 RepID=A0A0C9VWK8_9AGAM|nr:hypothetical protein HYDPIDRAFT_34950 [Hydnomerulius pinastri MD-312]